MRQSILLVVVLIWVAAAQAQVSNMPKNVQDWLAEVGPVWSKGTANPQKAREVYTPILRNAPKGGIRVTRDLSYGPDDLQKLDVYQPEGKSGVPIVVYVHGGSFVIGKRNETIEAWSNIPTYFARQGMVGVNADYRLAPAVQWPAGAEDVRAVVRWLKANGSTYGGDPNRICLIGQSAGATHVASYAYIKSLQPAEGPGVSGVVLMSGRYVVDPKSYDPNFNNVQAYFGTDASKYPERSVISHIKSAAPLPTFIVIAEYDNVERDVWGASLFSALCERHRACPRFARLEWHNHISAALQFNTADEALGREIVEFIRRGR
jgi:acetyl esterase